MSTNDANKFITGFVFFSIFGILLLVGIININRTPAGRQFSSDGQALAATNNNTTFQLTGPTSSATVGNTVSVEFALTTADGTAVNANVAELLVNFNTTHLQLNNVSESFNVLALNKQVDNANGKGGVDIAQTGGGNFSNNTTLVTFQFTVKDYGTAVSTVITVDPITRVGSGSNAIVGNLGSATISLQPQRSPFGGSAIVLPGTIEAENFDQGANNVSYFDKTSGNQGGATYRTSDVDIKDIAGGGRTIGFFELGEWLEYSTNVTQAKEYDIFLRTHSIYTGRSLKLYSNSQLIATVPVPQTSAWTEQSKVAIYDVPFSAGAQTLRIEMAGDNFADVDYLKVKDLPVACKADYDLSGTVDVPDLATFAANYKKSGLDCKFDIGKSTPTESCVLNAYDLLEFASKYKISNSCTF